jgi:hypothetical protein
VVAPKDVFSQADPDKPLRDKRLTRMIEECAASRRVRNRSVGEERQAAHAIYNQHRAQVKRRLRYVNRKWMDKCNIRMLKLRNSDSKHYWTILKMLTGRGKKPSIIPTEVMVGDQAIDGIGTYRVWQDAFAKLGALDHNNTFDTNSLEAISTKVVGWAEEKADCKQAVDDSELNKEIEMEEVAEAIDWTRRGMW